MRVMPFYFFGQDFLTVKKKKPLYDDLREWNERVGGWLTREGIYVHIWLIHNVVQHYKAIIFQ